MRNIIVQNPAPGSDSNRVELVFLTTTDSGLYEIDQLDLNSAGVTNTRRLTLIAYDPTQKPTLRWKVPTANNGATPTNLFTGPGWGQWLLQLATLDRCEVRDLILDGNWRTWVTNNTAANPAYVNGLKTGGIQVQASSGWITNVTARNFGANGMIPIPHWNTSGAESFVIYPTALQGHLADQWYVTDCVVEDFQGQLGGYGTGIMPLVKIPDGENFDPDANPNHRAFHVLRCQVRNSPTLNAFGSASSFGIRFSDNTVNNCAMGFNFDTANHDTPLRHIDVVGNTVDDVYQMITIGGPGHGANAAGKYPFRNFNVSSNNIRLRGVPLRQDYGSFSWKTNTYGSFTSRMSATDTNVIVGRLLTDSWSCGATLGGAGPVTFAANRFTTADRGVFYEPAPQLTNLAVWYPLYRPAIWPFNGDAVDQSGLVTITPPNRVSAWAYDQTNHTLLTTLSSLTNSRPALTAHPATPPPGDPEPDPEKPPIKLKQTLDENGTLLGVTEIQISGPLVTNGIVQLCGCLMYHPTLASGETDNRRLSPFYLHAEVETGPNAGVAVTHTTDDDDLMTFTYPTNGLPGTDTIRFREMASLQAEASTDIPLGPTVWFARSENVANDRTRHHATLRLRRSGPTNGALTVYLRPAANLPGPRVATSADYVLNGTNNVALPFSNGRWQLTFPAGWSEVHARVQPTVGGLTDEAEYEAAWFELATHSAWGYTVRPPADTLPRGPGNAVAVTLWDGPKYKLFELTDSYYYPCAGGGPPAAFNGQAESDGVADPAPMNGDLNLARNIGSSPPDEDLEFWTTASGGVAAVLQRPYLLLRTGQIISLEDETGGAWPEAGQAAETGAQPPPVVPSPDNLLCPCPADGSTAYALSQQATNAWIAGNTTYATYAYPGLPYPQFSLGGKWQAPAYGDLLHLGDAWAGSPSILAVDNTGNLAGSRLNRACYVTNGLASVFYLPGLATNRLGEVQWAAPAGSYLAGRTQVAANGAYYYRPVRWAKVSGLWTVTDVGSFDTNQATVGYAHMVNDSGAVVGRTVYGGAWRGFRTGTNGVIASIAANLLPFPTQPSTEATNSSGWITNLAGVALMPTNNAANAVNSTSDAVGASDFWIRRSLGPPEVWTIETRAALWWPGGTNAVILGAIHTGAGWQNEPGRSEALAVNRHARGITIVGTGWITPTGYARAFIKEVELVPKNYDTSATQQQMLDLNDAQLTYKSAGRTFTSAEAINDAGWIVGNGSSGSYTRGMVLVPQPTSAQ